MKQWPSWYAIRNEAGFRRTHAESWAASGGFRGRLPSARAEGPRQGAGGPGAPPVAGPAAPGVPGVNDGGATPMPGVGDPNAGISNKQLGFSRGPLPNRQLAPQNPAAKPATPLPAAPPNVQLDKIVFAPLPGVEGQVVGFDGKAPQAGARVLFVHADRQGAQQTVTADRQGQFRAELASGNWLVYLHAADGKPVFHSKIEVRDDNPNRLTLYTK